jgi:hypothetical protein
MMEQMRLSTDQFHRFGVLGGTKVTTYDAGFVAFRVGPARCRMYHDSEAWRTSSW